MDTTSVKQYIDQLANLDLDENSIATFVGSSSLNDYPPVPLGSHAGTSFFLKPTGDRLSRVAKISLTPLERMRETSQYVCKFDLTALPGSISARPGLRYGFQLGVLMHRPADSSSNSPTTDLEFSGFDILLNIVDRSVWITVDYSPWTDGYFRFDTPAVWGLLPGMTVQVGTMRISQVEWWTRGIIANGDPLTTYPPASWRIEGKPAVVSEYEDLAHKRNDFAFLDSVLAGA